MRNSLKSALLASALAVSACSSGLGTGNTDDTGGPQAAPSASTGLGVDLGFTLSDRINDDFAIAGAEIAGPTPEDTRRISFVAFTTESPNLNADGLGIGTTLTRDASSPSDTNGVADVFIMAIEDDLREQGTMGEQPAAFSRALVNTFRHSRCVHCHAMGSSPDVGDPFVFPGNNTHPGGNQPLLNDDCASCHNAPDVAPGVEWRSPRANNGQPFDMRGETIAELAARARSVDFSEHLLNDTRVTWALDNGKVPFAGGLAGSSSIWTGVPDIDVGPVPISFATFRAQLLAWEEAGFPVTAASSIRDVVMVSRASTGNAAANGAAGSPSITWVPNPGYNPANPSAQPAGEIVVAYASDATNVIGGGNSNSDVYRTRISVSLDRDPATGAVLAGGIDLSSNPATTELVSADFNGNNSDGDSTEPVIDATGNLIAYTSTALDLVSAFADRNGSGSDVFLRDMGLGSNVLVSANSPGGTTGGDGTSLAPAISLTGEAIAFESDAMDLVGGDNNGVRDVFFTVRTAGTLGAIERASVDSSGTEGDADSFGPTVMVGPTGRVSVAYTSDATNLAAVGAARNVLLREDGRTTNLAQSRVGGTAILANGDSSSPRLSPTAESILFTTAATNLDVVQPIDDNGANDILLVDLGAFRANTSIEGRRVTLDSAGLDADAASGQGRIGSFRNDNGSFQTQSFSFFRSNAEDLGVTRQDLVAVFISNEGVELRTDFAADDPVGPRPLTVMFSDASNGGPTDWLWDFGDGNSSTDQNPTHTYTSAGNFNVSLTVTRDSGTDTTTKNAFVRSLEPLSITSISTDNPSGPAPLTATFDSVLAGNQEGISFLWDFGDGNTSTDETPTHTYMSAGTFDVELTVTGEAGTDTLLENGFVDVATASGANFSFSQNGLRTTFTNLSSGNPTTFTWDFGDGNSSNLENPVHTYADNGARTVILTIDGPGGMDSISRVVTVNAVDFETTIFPYFAANSCSSCHGGSSPSGNLLISGASASSLYSALVGQLAQGSACNNGSRRRVEAFNVGNSLLHDVVDPGINACNNSAGMGNWTSGQIADLRDWINEGATFD